MSGREGVSASPHDNNLLKIKSTKSIAAGIPANFIISWNKEDGDNKDDKTLTTVNQPEGLIARLCLARP